MNIKMNNRNYVVSPAVPAELTGFYYKGICTDIMPDGTNVIGCFYTEDKDVYAVCKAPSVIRYFVMFLFGVIITALLFTAYYFLYLYDSVERDDFNVKYNDATIYFDGAVGVDIVNVPEDCTVYLSVGTIRSELVELHKGDSLNLIKIELADDSYYEGVLVFNTIDKYYLKALSISSSAHPRDIIREYSTDYNRYLDKEAAWKDE